MKTAWLNISSRCDCGALSSLPCLPNRGIQGKSSRAGKGFTLVELLIVLAIIAILVGLVIAGVSYATMQSRNNHRMAALNNIDKALIAFYDDHSYFPSSTTNSFVAVMDDFIDEYMEGSWEAPSATGVYYRTNVRNVVYMVCISQEQFGGGRLYSCKGNGMGTATGNWPQSSSEIDCEGVFDPVDCGSGPVVWDANDEDWDFTFE